jgi:aldose 1-epimerase
LPPALVAPSSGSGRCTALDFNEPRSLEDADPDGEGFDNNLVLRGGRDRGEPAATVVCPRNGVRLDLGTGEPALQIYDGAGASVAVPGHDGQTYGSFAGLCLEAQHSPDSVNKPDWPSIVRSPEHPYFQRLAVEIARG